MRIEKPTMTEDAARFWNMIAAAITAIGLVSGGLYTLRQYFDARATDSRNFNFQLKVAQAEAQKQYYAKTLDICYEVTTATATIATSTNKTKRQQATQDFWRFYYGPLAIVENRELSNSMSQFGECLAGVCKSAPGKDSLKVLSENIANSCRIIIEHGLNVGRIVESPIGFQAVVH